MLFSRYFYCRLHVLSVCDDPRHIFWFLFWILLCIKEGFPILSLFFFSDKLVLVLSFLTFYVIFLYIYLDLISFLISFFHCMRISFFLLIGEFKPWRLIILPIYSFMCHSILYFPSVFCCCFILFIYLFISALPWFFLFVFLTFPLWITFGYQGWYRDFQNEYWFLHRAPKTHIIS